MKDVRNTASHIALDLIFLDFQISDHEKLTYLMTVFSKVYGEQRFIKLKFMLYFNSGIISKNIKLQVSGRSIL